MKEDVLKKYDDAVVGAKGQLYDDAFAEGKASVVVPTEGGQYTKEQVDQLIAGAIAALPADGTPYSQEQMDAIKTEMQASIDALAADDAAQKAAKDALQAKWDKVAEFFAPAAPVEPLPAA